MKAKLMIVVLVGVLLIPLLTLADTPNNKVTLEGTIQGINCVIYGKLCPKGAEDPVIAFEPAFVLVLPDKSYYLIPNMDRAILSRHILHKVRVTGTIDKFHKSIQADKFEHWDPTKKGFVVTWSIEMQEEARKRATIGF